MKKTLKISSMALGCLALAMGFVLAPKAQAAKPVNGTLTGQSIMVNLQAEGTFAIVQTLTYKYNRDTAATYFTNLWDGDAPDVSLGNIHEARTQLPSAPLPFLWSNQSAPPPQYRQARLRPTRPK